MFRNVHCGGLISQQPQTAGLWCVPVRPAWCPETPGSAPPSPQMQGLHLLTSRPSGRTMDVPLIPIRSRVDRRGLFGLHSPWTEPSRWGRTDGWWSLSLSPCPLSSPTLSAWGERLHTHTQFKAALKHIWTLTSLTLIIESFCPPCWAEEHNPTSYWINKFINLLNVLHWCVCESQKSWQTSWLRFDDGPDSPVLQQDLGDQVLQASMKGLREEVEDLLWGAQVVEDDIIRQDVEGLDQLEDRQNPQMFSSMRWLLLCVLFLYFLPISDFQSSGTCVYLRSLACRDAEWGCCGLCKQTTRTSVTLDTNVLHCFFGRSLKTISIQKTTKISGIHCSHVTKHFYC